MTEAVETLRRQVSNLIRLASVVDVNALDAQVKVRFMDMTTAWIPWLTFRAGSVRSWSALTEGEQVLLLCPNGETEQAIVLTALYQSAFAAPSGDLAEHRFQFVDGAVLAYHTEHHRLSVRLPDGATLDIASSGGVTVTGDVTITGNLMATGEVSDGTRAISGDRAIYNSHKHGSSPTPDKTQ